MQKALEQTAEKAVGLQPLVAHLSDAVKEAHKHSHSTQTQSEQTCCVLSGLHIPPAMRCGLSYPQEAISDLSAFACVASTNTFQYCLCMQSS